MVEWKMSKSIGTPAAGCDEIKLGADIASRWCINRLLRNGRFDDPERADEAIVDP